MRLNSLLDGAVYRSRRRWLAVGMSILLLTLSGCVYLRLLTIKNQLAKFDRFFKVEVTDSFTLNFLEPKLYGRDIIYLSELQPSQRTPVPAGEEWTFLFKKMISETEIAPDSSADIYFLFRLNQEDLLSALTLSPILMRIAPPEFLELSIRALGNAKVDQKKRQIQGELGNLPRSKTPLPKRDEILNYLGKPFSEETVQDTTLITYRYRLETTGLKPEQEKRRLSIAQLYFDPKTNELIRFHGRFAGLKISINYRKLTEERFAARETGN